MYATKKIDFTYSSATIERRFTLIRELELSKVWYQILLDEELSLMVVAEKLAMPNDRGFAPIFPDTCYHLTHYWPAAADIPVASDNPVHYADAIRYNARTPLQGSLLPLTRLV